MSAEIIQFIPRPWRVRGGTDSALASSYSPWRPDDDLVMGHADTAPCEVLSMCERGGGEDEPA